MYSKPPYLASLVLLLLSSRSHAQNLSDLPSCAQSPALSAIGSTGCQASDFKCLCKDNSFINAALAGAEKQCPQADLQKVIAFAQQLCGSVGVSLSVSATAANGGSSSNPSSPPTITNTTPSPSAVTTSSQPSQSEASSSSRSADAAATTPTSQTSNGNGRGGSATSGAGAGFDLRGVIASGAAVVGWWVFGVWA